MTRSRPSLATLASFVALGAALSLAACGGNQAGAPVSPATPASPAAAMAKPIVKEAGDAKVGDMAKCPVSGEEFIVDATSPKTEHDGKTYFFCCSGCKKKFEAEPAKFTKKS